MSQPTVVLVHGAFAESASWSKVITRLSATGHTVAAAPNELRSVAADAATVSALLATIEGPVVLVGHSYGGAVISNAAHGNEAVRALVFIAAFAPETGESIGELSGKFPGSTLGDTLLPASRPDGSTDLYIRRDLFHQQFAADLPADEAAIAAATQRPLSDVALNEGASAPAWRHIPSWFLIPGEDRNIPVEAQEFMAERAGARETVRVPGASHAVAVSQPDEVAALIGRVVEAVA